jgi:hypothetical protein
MAAGLAVLSSCGSGADRPSADASGTPSTGGPTTTTTVAPTTTTVPSTTTTAVPTHVFPLDPPSACDYGPGHHDYPATDIFCPIGTAFVAVTSGTVDFVTATDEWDPATDDPALRGGLSVAIVGDDGVRYYGSHLSAVEPGIEPGVQVEAGQVLGRTGDSGNAAGTDPHLHFGVSHPTTPDDWQVRRGEVDTFPLLQAWERGENVTPTVPAG